MKKGVHPKYGDSVIRCACGNVVETGSTVSEMKIEICSACHPFYTGKKKIVDATGRVDRFMKRFEKSKEIKAKIASSGSKKKAAPKKKAEAKKK